MKHYKDEINLFIDCELDADKREELFSHLSECNECRDLMADLLLLKDKSQKYCSDNISNLKTKPKSVNKYYMIGFYISSAAAVLLIFLLTTSKPKEVYITKNEVRVDTVFVQKDVPITTVNNLNSFIPGKKEGNDVSSQQRYIDYVKSMRTVIITDADIVKERKGS